MNHKDEIEAVLEFIDRKRAGATQEADHQSSEPTTAEKLRNLAELHGEGVITDEEFETTKAGLLEEM